MIILGLDPATRKFGWSLLRNGTRIASGTWVLSSGKGERFPSRMKALYGHLIEIDNTVLGPIDLVAWEKPFSERPGSLLKQGKSLGVIDLWIGRRTTCAHESIEVNPVDLKRWAAGKGNATKQDMIAACKRRLSYTTTDDDEADACLVGLYAWHSVNNARAKTA